MKVLAVVLMLTSSLVACDSNNGDGNGDPATGCNLNFAVTNANGKAFGEGCTADSECMYNECYLPGETGNDTNSVFGFCTRGCDCEDNRDAQIPDGFDELLDCRYPTDGAGTFKLYHHIVVQCNDVSECQALDPRWTSCELPNNEGGARDVCAASPVEI